MKFPVYSWKLKKITKLVKPQKARMLLLKGIVSQPSTGFQPITKRRFSKRNDNPPLFKYSLRNLI